MRILGIDCSSTTIGWCLLDLDITNSNISLIKMGYIKPDKNGDIIERIATTRDKVNKLIEEYKPDEVAIEQIIKFMKGLSSAQTIIILTTFNRMIGLLAYDCLGKLPIYYNVMSIRHGLKINKILPKKEDLPELVSKHLGIKFPYEYNKKGNLKPENFDKSDAVAVALYHAFVLSGKTKKKKK